LTELLKADPGQLTSETAATKGLGLGYRGLIVRRTKPDDVAGKKPRQVSEILSPTRFASASDL
jgi:hypothetical protein